MANKKPDDKKPEPQQPETYQDVWDEEGVDDEEVVQAARRIALLKAKAEEGALTRAAEFAKNFDAAGEPEKVAE